ncbi:uncharacterized protein JCM6883_002653 [Sporobolomyces salmoneus]|uniref:uncharacterized protein n=1 Tax=Sporobolomyces salmoneus TaxID=183962 RepID=UPI00317092DC
MGRPSSARKSPSSSSSNFKSPSPLTLPLFLAIAPITLLALLLWPLLALGSLIPVLGLISLTSLLSCTVFLYLAIPTTFHLLFSQDRQSYKKTLLPFRLPRIQLFTPSVLTPIRLTHSILRLFYEAHLASLPSLFFDSISKRILILGGSDSDKIVKENIVYLSSANPGKTPSKRLDVYFPDRTTLDHREEEGSLAPVVLVIASPSYRFLSSKSFPSSQIALRLRRLGYCVVVPSLTSFPHGTNKEMVHEIRECLRWISEEVRSFGGDKERVWVLGQGVGASLTALTVVQSAVVVSRDEELRRREEREDERRKRESRVQSDSRNGRDSADEGDGDRYGDKVTGDPFFEEQSGSHSRDASSNSPIYEGHYFRSTTHGRPTSTTTVPYSDEEGEGEGEGEGEEGDGASIASSDTLPFPSGVNACKIFCGPENGEDIGRTQPEDRGETISNWNGMKIRGMILVGGVYDTIKQLKRESELGLSEGNPCHLLFAASSLLSSSSTPNLLPSKFLIIHGGADRIVPYSQSVLLKNLLFGVGISSERVRLRLYREETGLGSLASLMHQTKYSPLILDEIERMISSEFDDAQKEEKVVLSHRPSKGQGKHKAR